MSRKLVSIVVTLLVIGLLLPMAIGQRSASEQEAVRAARVWLTTVDQSRYAESWDDSATYFQEAVPKETWVRQLDGVRRPLGQATSRKLVGAKRMSQLPGAPDGDYVVIQFHTSFANKKDATEIITPMKDGKRGWRVSGYYIK